MSNLTPCIYCHRLYSKYSLNLHQPKCFYNPSSKIQEDINNLNNKEFILPYINKKSEKRRNNPCLNRSKSSSFNENKILDKINSSNNLNSKRRFSNEDNNRNVSQKIATTSVETSNEIVEKLKSVILTDTTQSILDRPKTQTLYTSQENCENYLMCFICGVFCEPQLIKNHQEQCLIIWETIHKQLPMYIRSTPPKIINVPSVDGTINITRHNQLAEASFKKCQRTRCNRCGKYFNFNEVLNHVCQCFEPKFELYF